MTDTSRTVDVALRRRRPFVTLLTANTISYLGSVLTIVALPWFVLVTTGSAARTGLTGAVQVTAFVVSGILGGSIVDRVGFRRASVVSDLLSAAPLAAIPALYHTVGLSFSSLLVLVFLAEAFSQPGATARESLLPNVADQAHLTRERANAVYHAVPRFAQLVGPAVAGVLIAVTTAGNVLWLDAGTFLISSLLVATGVTTITGGSTSDRSSMRVAIRRYGHDLHDGIRLLTANRLLAQLTLNNALGNLLGAALAGVVLPVYARQVFHSPVALGVMTSSYGAGALAGVALYGVIGHRLSRRTVYLGCWTLVGLAQLPLIGLPNLLVVGTVLALLGLGSGPNLPLTFTVAQEQIPEAARGRFFGLRSALANAVSPLGLVGAGLLLEASGLRITIMMLVVASGLLTFNALFNPAFSELNVRRAADE